MKSQIVISTLLLGLQINSVHAGLYNTTVHSRANCLNNESITWWQGHPTNWKVVSIHKHYQAGTHLIDTGYNTNDRVAAVHWGEGVHGGFVVWGYHYRKNYHESAPFETTYAEGCNIIDGWD
ncbi:MAG: hypothetical protein H0T84_04585 [Tatlockia sp.]|nr:hypothetical protein [Tatlockia sp.]